MTPAYHIAARVGWSVLATVWLAATPAAESATVEVTPIDGPLTIDRPGHYRLAADISVGLDDPLPLIEVTAPGVTIDLAGFTLRSDSLSYEPMIRLRDGSSLRLSGGTLDALHVAIGGRAAAVAIAGVTVRRAFTRGLVYGIDFESVDRFSLRSSVIDAETCVRVFAVRAIVDDNRFIQCGEGAVLQVHADSGSIRRNDFHISSVSIRGLQIDGGDVRIERNLIDGSPRDTVILRGQDFKVHDNVIMTRRERSLVLDADESRISNNSFGSVYEALVVRGSGNTIDGNDVSTLEGPGLWFDGGEGNVFRRNTLNRADGGPPVEGDTAGNVDGGGNACTPSPCY